MYTIYHAEKGPYSSISPVYHRSINSDLSLSTLGSDLLAGRRALKVRHAIAAQKAVIGGQELVYLFHN